ncbi:MAG: hypothetical protein ABIQ35_15725, partial [Verrucomicrobiota bacterium]
LSGPDSIIGGLSQFTGMIDLTTDKRSIVVAGYNTNIGAMNLEVAGSPRAVGTVSSSGDFQLGVRTTTGGSTFRGAVSDGLGNFWSGGQAGGIQYLGSNSAPIQISTLGTGTGIGAIRNMIMVNGSPYFSTSQFPSTGNHGVAAFNGAPLTPVEPQLVIVTTSIPGASGTPNAKGFCVNSNLTIAYVVDIRTAATGGGIYRFNGTGSGTANSWTYAYTIPLDLYPNGTFQEVVANFSGVNPIIYATAGPGSGNSQGGNAGNDLISTVDTGAGSLFESLMTAPAGTTFRGLTFAPTAPVGAPVLSIAKSGSDVVISWSGGGTLRSSATVTGPYNPVAGAPTSPYATSPTNSAFYRVSIP